MLAQIVMQRIAESELIINPRGAIYHLNLKPDELAVHVITVGDPGRVKEVSKYFDRVEVQRQHREFITHTGYIGSKRISVISTGIGPDNIDIVLNELDALANINFETRTVNDELKQLNIIRIGTSGSLQGDVPVDSFVASTHGLGIDNLMNFYLHENNEEEKQLIHSFLTQTQLHSGFGNPYIAAASMHLLKYFVDGYHQGVTVTCPGFYGPQGRILRLGISNPQLIDSLTSFQFGTHRIANFEMETSAIYGLGKMLHHNCLSLNAIITNRIHKNFSRDTVSLIDNLIKKSLEIITENL